MYNPNNIQRGDTVRRAQSWDNGRTYQVGRIWQPRNCHNYVCWLTPADGKGMTQWEWIANLVKG